MTRQLAAVLGRGVVPTADPIATADDVGLVRGDGCFDAMRVLGGGSDAVVENLDDHLVRFAASAATLDLSFDPLPAHGWLAEVDAATGAEFAGEVAADGGAEGAETNQQASCDDGELENFGDEGCMVHGVTPVGSVEVGKTNGTRCQ